MIAAEIRDPKKDSGTGADITAIGNSVAQNGAIFDGERGGVIDRNKGGGGGA